MDRSISRNVDLRKNFAIYEPEMEYAYWLFNAIKDKDEVNFCIMENELAGISLINTWSPSTLVIHFSPETKKKSLKFVKTLRNNNINVPCIIISQEPDDVDVTRDLEVFSVLKFDYKPEDYRRLLNHVNLSSEMWHARDDLHDKFNNILIDFKTRQKIAVC